MAFDKQNTVYHTPPTQKPPVIIFYAMACMLKVNFQLIFYFCKKLRQVFHEKTGRFGIPFAQNITNVMNPAGF